MMHTPTTDRQEVTRVGQTSKLPSASRWSRIWTWAQFVICLILTSAVLVYLLRTPSSAAHADSESRQCVAGETVRLQGPSCISIQPGCPLAQKLQVTTIAHTSIKDPVLTVTGTVIASLRPGNGKGNDYWQFNSPEVLTAFTDWEKATADIAFAQTQLTAIRQLAETRVNAQQSLVDRMKRLVAAGTDTEKDLAAAEADLIQSEIQGRKDLHEAETAVRLAQRAEAAQARQLQQAGLEPELLRSVTRDVDIVMADVPEAVMSQVKLGQGCEARFFGLPHQVFSGKVRAISPVLSKERRSLRVLFAIGDPRDELRPGMFADIGLGTDPRKALLIPADGIVHVGRSDYVLVGSGESNWQVTEVQVGELHESAVEILDGIRAGDRVAGHGAILLKPYMIEALHRRAATTGGRS
jgi:hypothetical protein